MSAASSTRTPPVARRSTASGSTSYSSVISPTISSSRSSMVTSPAVPPYSSTTIAKWVRRACMSRSSSSAGFESGTKQRRPHHGLDPLRGLGLVLVEDPLGDVLEVGDADDVVEVLADDRDPGEPAAQRQRHELAKRLVALDEDHVGTRDHHLAHEGVAELEDRVDHPALVGLDDAGLLGQVDHLAQLSLGRERALAEAAARRDGVADQDERCGQRAQHGVRAPTGAAAAARPARSAGGRPCAARRRRRCTTRRPSSPPRRER